MANARTLLKVCCAVAAVSADECADGSCQSESATMLQTKKRSIEFSPHRNAIQDLRQSSIKLLEEGAAPMVVEWASNSTRIISDEVEAAIEHAHKLDIERVANSFAVFAEIAREFAEEVDMLEKLHLNHTKARELHIKCREEEDNMCKTYTKCVMDGQDLKKRKDHAHDKFQTAVDSVKYCDGDPTEPMHGQEQRHHKYVTAGKKFFEELEAYETQQKACKGVQDQFDENRTTCNDYKAVFEEAACNSHREFTTSYNDMVQRWDDQVKSYDNLTNIVTELMDDRRMEWERLTEVKCLLAKVVKRGGKPCDTDTEEGEDAGDSKEEIEKQCAQDQTNTSHLDIVFPKEPPQPSKPDEPYPCTPKFVEIEYGNLTGPCFDNLPACKACDGSSVVHRAGNEDQVRNDYSQSVG